MLETILITGGTGTTGRRISSQLADRGVRYRVGTRRPNATHDIRFDWSDETSWSAALESVSSIYLVAPSGVADPLPTMILFMELAIR
ncbi:MAG: NAD-dependent epimerase/dehydratase family protein, partial [Pseudomonadota bacterium]